VFAKLTFIFVSPYFDHDAFNMLYTYWTPLITWLLLTLHGDGKDRSLQHIYNHIMTVK